MDFTDEVRSAFWDIDASDPLLRMTAWSILKREGFAIDDSCCGSANLRWTDDGLAARTALGLPAP